MIENETKLGKCWDTVIIIYISSSWTSLNWRCCWNISWHGVHGRIEGCCCCGHLSWTSIIGCCWKISWHGVDGRIGGCCCCGHLSWTSIIGCCWNLKIGVKKVEFFFVFKPYIILYIYCIDICPRSIVHNFIVGYYIKWFKQATNFLCTKAIKMVDILSVPKFTANLYCICWSIYLRYT